MVQASPVYSMGTGDDHVILFPPGKLKTKPSAGHEKSLTLRKRNLGKSHEKDKKRKSQRTFSKLKEEESKKKDSLLSRIATPIYRWICKHPRLTATTTIALGGICFFSSYFSSRSKCFTYFNRNLMPYEGSYRIDVELMNESPVSYNLTYSSRTPYGSHSQIYHKNTTTQTNWECRDRTTGSMGNCYSVTRTLEAYELKTSLSFIKWLLEPVGEIAQRWVKIYVPSSSSYTAEAPISVCPVEKLF